MMFPDSLLPKTEKEILKEVSNELNIPYKDVLKTFNIWLDYIEYITKKTEECTIFFPNIGRAYLSKVRLQSADKNTKVLYYIFFIILRSLKLIKNIKKLLVHSTKQTFL